MPTPEGVVSRPSVLVQPLTRPSVTATRKPAHSTSRSPAPTQAVVGEGSATGGPRTVVSARTASAYGAPTLVTPRSSPFSCSWAGAAVLADGAGVVGRGVVDDGAGTGAGAADGSTDGACVGSATGRGEGD